MRRKFLIFCNILITFLLIHAKAWSQCTIALHIPDAADSTVYLAFHMNGQIFVADTTKLDHTGKGSFAADTLLQQGLYLIYLNKDNFVDFLLSKDQKLAIEHNFSKPDRFTIKGSSESEAFQRYKLFLKELKGQQDVLIKQKETHKSNADSLKNAEIKLQELDKKVNDYWIAESNKYPETYYGRFLMANIVPTLQLKDIPTEYQKNDSLKWVYEYNFRKNHFWDNLDVSDRRFMRTPILRPRLETYFDKVLLQIPDSITPSVFKLIDKTRKDPVVFQYVTSFLLNHFITSNIMGMDAVFVRMAEKYYLSGLATWADTTSLKNIATQVVLKRNNLIGMKAHELKLESADGPYYSLNEIKSDYTVLAFWEPDCGHCKKQIPELYQDVFLPLKGKSVTFYAVNSTADKEKWTNFINEKKLYDWINVWDPYNTSDFKVNFDVQTTPMIYILDKDKKIIAKKIDPATVKDILNSLLK